MIDINAIDKETMDAIQRYDAMDASDPLKRLAPGQLTPGLISRSLLVDTERAEFILGMLQSPLGDVVTVSESL